MSQVVFILGAGASKDCGAPLMGDFLDTASHLVSMEKTDGRKDDFLRVFRAISELQIVHSKSQLDLNNIESVFTTLEIAHTLGKLPGFEPEEIEGVIASLKELIVVTLEQTIKFPAHRNSTSPPKTYKRFADLVGLIKEKANPKRSVSVISFNYDIALDVAMYWAGMGPSYGLKPTKSSPEKVNLLKLHGSLNWAIREDSREIVPVDLKDYFSKYRPPLDPPEGGISVPIGSRLKDYFEKIGDVAVSNEPAIVPPAWNKSEYHQMLSAVWGTAASELEEAEYIFIIGYSLPETDAFFKLLYSLGTVGDALLKKVKIFNPDESGDTENRFREMMGPGSLSRFEYHPVTFEDAIAHVEGMFGKSSKNISYSEII